MIKRFGALWYSLNGRLRLCGAVAIIGIAAATLFSLASSWQAAYGEVSDYFLRVEAEMTARLDAGLGDIQDVARNAGYSIAVQRFLLFNNPETVIMNYNPAVEHITNVLSNTEYVRNIYLRNAGGRYLRANRDHLTEILRGTETHARGVVLDRPLFDILSGEEDGTGLYFYLPVYNVLWVGRTNEILCGIYCDLSSITSAPVFRERDPGGTVLLLYKNSIVSASRGISPAEQEDLSRMSQSRRRLKIGGQLCYAIKVTLSEGQGRGRTGSGQLWDCIYFIPERMVIASILSRVNRGFLILSAVVFLVILILALIIHSVNAGVSRMVGDFNALDYGGQLPLRSPRLKELEIIFRSAGLMLKRINTAVMREQEANGKLLEAVTAQAQAEFMSYRTQINPHFLFNTLECMRAKARSSKDPDLETMISSMSRMFRYSLYAKPMVSFSLELEHMQNYMRVINIRSGGRYTLKTRVSTAAMDRLVPSMILQPLVENSITHGFVALSQNNCVIFLEATCSGYPGEPMRLRLADNGAGMENPEVLLSSLEEEGYRTGITHALYNILKRMRLSFGSGFHFAIKSKAGHYTVIEMLIPAEAELAIPEIK
jgi:two-component system sensor histidine kinase YesM